MYPDSPFAVPVGSFRYPVPLPNLEPDATPTIAISINCQWLAYIRGALKQLLLQSTWNTTDPDAINLVQERVFKLIDLFVDCDNNLLPFDCEMNLAANSYGWSNHVDPNTSPTTQGTWALSSGWIGTDFLYQSGQDASNAVDIILTLANPIHLLTFRMDFDITIGTCDNGPAPIEVHFYRAGVQQAAAFYTTNNFVNGVNEVNFGVDADVDQIRIVAWDSAFTIANGGSVGSITIFVIEMTGAGQPPCQEV